MKTIGSSIPLSVSIKDYSFNVRADIELHTVYINLAHDSVCLLKLGLASRASEQTPLPTIQPDLMDAPNNSAAAPLMVLEPEILQGHIPAGHIPKPVIIADYVA